jgi:hypothetical protein
MLGSILCRVLPAAHALTGVNPVRNLMTFVHQNKQAQVHFYLPNQIATVLYDPKARFAWDHGDLNKLRSRIAQ